LAFPEFLDARTHVLIDVMINEHPEDEKKVVLLA